MKLLDKTVDFLVELFDLFFDILDIFKGAKKSVGKQKKRRKK